MVILSINSPTEIGTRMSCGWMSRGGLMLCPPPMPSHASPAEPSMATKRRASSWSCDAGVSGSKTWGRARSSSRVSTFGMVGNEFQERAVGVAEIDAGAGPLGAEALQRPGLDRNAAALEVNDGIRDRSVPLEADIAVARSYRKPRDLGRMKSRSMQVELRGAETVGPALWALNELGAQYIAIERVRALPIGDMHHAVVEGDG